MGFTYNNPVIRAFTQATTAIAAADAEVHVTGNWLIADFEIIGDVYNYATMRLHHELKAGAVITCTWYRNGVAITTMDSQAAGTYIGYDHDMVFTDLQRGDILQCKANSTDGYIKNIRILAMEGIII